MGTRKNINLWKALQKVPAGTMFVPLIIGAIILLTLIAVHRSRTPGSDIVIVNDMEELEEEEGLNRP